MEFKKQSGHITECKEMDSNGIPVGVVKGYIATWDIDSWSDQFEKGCFAESLEELRMKSKDLPLKAEHMNVIGKFPVNTIYEDERGLFGEANINLEVQEGKEFYSLAKQGAIVDFSIGYVAQEKEMVAGVRKIRKSRVLDGSMVGNPMNENANITEVKSRDELPKKFCDKTVHFNPSNIDDEKAYLFEKSLQIADIIDDELIIIPRAVINARFKMIEGLEGMTDQEKEEARKTINSLYVDMGFREPFKDGKSQLLNRTEIKSVKGSTLVDILKKTFSKEASSHISGLILADVAASEATVETVDVLKDTLEKLKQTQENLSL